MFVVWRKKPVTSAKRVELFGSYQDLGGGPRRKVTDRSDLCRLWQFVPLFCEHKGDGRVAFTPLLMRAERVDGKPRQKLVKRLPGIRSCCAADPLTRAVWWHAVQDEFGYYKDWDVDDSNDFHRDRV